MADQLPIRRGDGNIPGMIRFQGDDTFFLDYTSGAGNILDIKKSGTSKLTIDNKVPSILPQEI